MSKFIRLFAKSVVATTVVSFKASYATSWDAIANGLSPKEAFHLWVKNMNEENQKYFNAYPEMVIDGVDATISTYLAFLKLATKLAPQVNAAKEVLPLLYDQVNLLVMAKKQYLFQTKKDWVQAVVTVSLLSQMAELETMGLYDGISLINEGLDPELQQRFENLRARKVNPPLTFQKGSN